MKPAPFAFHRAKTLEDAVSRLGTSGVARPLAGGQSLVPMLNLRLAPVDALVDIRQLDALKRVDAGADTIRYGAAITHAAFEDGLVPDAANGLMRFVGGQIAYRAVRNRGTIGGALALADPAADWLTVVVALEAKIAVIGVNGRREIDAEAFVLGPYYTALDEGELIEAVVVPRRAKSERWGHYKVAAKAGEYADSMAIVLVDHAAGSARVTLGATDGAPIVLPEVAGMIRKGSAHEALADAARGELAGSGRDFSPAKLRLHGTVIARAAERALAERAS